MRSQNQSRQVGRAVLLSGVLAVALTACAKLWGWDDNFLQGVALAEAVDNAFFPRTDDDGIVLELRDRSNQVGPTHNFYCRISVDGALTPAEDAIRVAKATQCKIAGARTGGDICGWSVFSETCVAVSIPETVYRGDVKRQQKIHAALGDPCKTLLDPKSTRYAESVPAVRIRSHAAFWEALFCNDLERRRKYTVVVNVISDDLQKPYPGTTIPGRKVVDTIRLPRE